MTSELEQLVSDVVAATGEKPPALLEADAPTLSAAALSGTDFYLIGLIGGKEVGKSALVNAIVGQPITRTTSFGAGTDQVIAYVHDSRAAAVRAMMDREVPGRYRLVPHSIDGLARQVLLDLPDIDSHWESHAELTRRVLRHMLFPLWVQSVEKYADRQPQQLLAEVAGGNAAGNFLFCLNKADQVASMSGNDPGPLEELRADFSGRVGKTLSVDPPRVWMLSANKPDQYDLPELRKLLANQKSDGVVRQSQESARRQQDKTILAWLAVVDLPGRVARLARVEQQAAEELDTRIGTPLIESSLPALAEDPATRLALTDEVLAGRVVHWPVVGLVHTVLTPVLAVVRRNVGATRQAALPDAEALVDAHLRPNGVSVAALVRSSFAMLQQASPQISELYRDRRLWEDMTADEAAASLRIRLTNTVARQRESVRQKLSGRGPTLAPLRWALTIGALVWFPFVQPIAAFLLENHVQWTWIESSHNFAVLVVKIFSVNAVLENLTFLAMYFFVLWVVLRWDTTRRINRLAGRWKSDTSELSLTAHTIQWLDELRSPIRIVRERVEALADRAKEAGRE